MTRFLLTCVFLLSAFTGVAWPVYVHLDIGESKTVIIGGKEYQLKVYKTTYTTEPNNRIPPNIGSQTLKEARVTLSINGDTITLVQRAYQMPIEFKGLRLYVENTRNWVKKANKFQAITYFPKTIKIAIGQAGKSWGPDNMHFPIVGYRWRSAMYNNTWSSLVPGNGVYYHHGEDFGVMPDKLNIQAILSGIVTTSPLPDGDGASNGLIIRYDTNFSYRLSHMNIGTIKSGLLKGTLVREHQILAKTGQTYLGKEKMGNPHLHVNFIYKGEAVSPYPYLVEAYFNDYPDNVLAIAGGYAYVMAGDEVELDASRSVARRGQKIISYSWELPDGRIVKTAHAKVRFGKPGTYTITLNVLTDKGDRDRDFLQVYVFDTEKRHNDFLGYFYHMPVRGLKVGEDVTVWRAYYGKVPLLIDFGDGSKPVKAGLETPHKYRKPGIYTVTVTSTQPSARPTTEKMKIVVGQ